MSDMQKRFGYHRDNTNRVNREMFAIGVTSLAQDIQTLVEDARCREMALTRLEEVSMWANKGM